jgi:hypothetical protein
MAFPPPYYVPYKMPTVIPNLSSSLKSTRVKWKTICTRTQTQGTCTILNQFDFAVADAFHRDGASFHLQIKGWMRYISWKIRTGRLVPRKLPSRTTQIPLEILPPHWSSVSPAWQWHYIARERWGGSFPQLRNGVVNTRIPRYWTALHVQKALVSIKYKVNEFENEFFFTIQSRCW